MERKEWVKQVDQDNKQFVGKGSILILHEKHGDRFYAVPTLDALYAAAVATIIERNEEGWFYEPDQPDIMPFMKEQIDALPAGETKDSLTKLYEDKQRQLTQYAQDLKDWYVIQQAIKEEDGRTAWQVMRQHKSYEYEDWNIETAIDATENPLNKEKVEL
jgi:hypothetical protein